MFMDVLYNQNSFLLEGESSFAFFCLFFYIPHPLDAPLVPQNI
jgi:hypothetical protein